MVGIYPILMKNDYTQYKYFPEDNKIYIPGIIEYHHDTKETGVLKTSNKDFKDEDGQYHYAKEALQEVLNYHN